MATLNAIRESLWGLGVPEAQLSGLPTSSPEAMKTEMRRLGIDVGLFDKANVLADWRPDSKKTYRDNFSGLLRALGLPAEQVTSIMSSGATGTRDLIAAVSRVVNPQIATNMAIKLQLPQDIPQGAPPWNPFRSDAPETPPTPLAPGHRPLVRPGVSPTTGAAPGGAPGAPGAGRVSTTGVTPTPGDTAAAVTTTAAATAVTDTTPALGANATEDQVRAYVNKHYGQYAYLYDVPELKDKVIRPAVEAGWGADEVLGALQATAWWKKTEDSARLWLETKHIDPATAQDQVQRKFVEFRNLARAKGVSIPDRELREIAEDSIEFAWDDNETTAAMGRFFRYDPDALLGEAADTAIKMRQLHKAYLIPLSDATVQTWTEKVVRGEATAEDFEDYLSIQAKALFPMFAKQIDMGVAPDVWVNPYREIAAQTLGMSADAIDFRDPKWMRAIDEVDPKTGQRRPMYLSEWTNLLKTDEAYGWDKTAGGREHGANLASSIGQLFGRS